MEAAGQKESLSILLLLLPFWKGFLPLIVLEHKMAVWLAPRFPVPSTTECDLTNVTYHCSLVSDP